MYMKIIFFAILIIFTNGCVAQKTNSINPNYIDQLMSQYDGQILTPPDVNQIHLNTNENYSYKMKDLENNQIYSYNYIGMKDDLFQFEILTKPLFLKEVISLNKHAQFIKSNLFSYDKSCSFVIGRCERIRQVTNGVKDKEKVETSFENGMWVIKVYREMNNEFVLHSLTHSIYDKKGLPIYNKTYFIKHNLSVELVRVPS